MQRLSCMASRSCMAPLWLMDVKNRGKVKPLTPALNLNIFLKYSKSEVKIKLFNFKIGRAALPPWPPDKTGDRFREYSIQKSPCICNEWMNLQQGNSKGRNGERSQGFFLHTQIHRPGQFSGRRRAASPDWRRAMIFYREFAGAWKRCRAWTWVWRHMRPCPFQGPFSR